MERTKISTIFDTPEAFYGQEPPRQIKVNGWVRFYRKAKKDTLLFIDVYDGSTCHDLCAIIERDPDGSLSRSPPSAFDEFFSKCAPGASVELLGRVENCEGEREQSIEFIVTHPVVLGTMPKSEAGVPENPIQKTNMNHMHLLREWVHLRARTPIMASIFRVRSKLINKIYEYFKRKGVWKLDPNTITQSDCEGGGETLCVTTLIDAKRSIEECLKAMRVDYMSPSEIRDAYVTKLKKSGELETTPETQIDEYVAAEVKRRESIDFTKDLFGVPAFMTVSSQLQLELMACAMGDVFCDNNSYRAEKSKTYKHVTEFTHFEKEEVFGTLPSLLANAEDFVKCTFLETIEEARDDLENIHRIKGISMKTILEEQTHLHYEELFKTRPKSLEGSVHVERIIAQFAKMYVDLPVDREAELKSLFDAGYENVKGSFKKGKWLALKRSTLGYMTDLYLKKYHHDRIQELEKYLSKPFTILEYRDAVKDIKEYIASGTAPEEYPDMEYGDDLHSDHEKYLVQKYDGFVFVIKWPLDIKSFYMKRNIDDPELCDNFDLLAPYVGEMFGGSMREDVYDLLLAEMEKRKMDTKPLQWYLDIRKFGSVPHGGWGFGFDRGLLLLTGAASIKDVIPFPCSYQSLPC